MRRSFAAAAAVAVFVSFQAALAADIPVAPGQSIQAAIVAAQAGDRVLVQPGTYLEAIDFLGKGIEVIGVGGASVTTIDATGLNTSVVTMDSGEPASARLEGFRITGGTGTAAIFPVGGGIYAPASAATIEQCVIEGNTALGGLGGGAFLTGETFSQPATKLRRSIVRGNTASAGAGGVAGGHLERVRIEGNSTSGGHGGGVLNCGSFATLSCSTTPRRRAAARRSKRVSSLPNP